MSLPSQARWRIGLTSCPLISGEVSTWATKPMVGTCSKPGVAGTVAKRYPFASTSTSCRPICRSSAAMACWSTVWPGVLGHVSEVSSDCVLNVA